MPFLTPRELTFENLTPAPTGIRTTVARLRETMLALYLLVAVLATAVGAEPARFDNYQVYRLIPDTQEQVDLLHELANLNQELSFWSGPGRVNTPVDIMVPPHKLPEFQDILEDLNIKHEVFIEDVQRAIDNVQNHTPRSGFGWNNYYRLDDIYSWLDSLVNIYPGIVTPIVGGSSFEGRQIKGVKVSYKPGNRGVFMEGGIHAREWISPATVTYILNELLTSRAPAVRDIAENYDWYFFPVTNPDGYEFTHTSNRLWRKTRSRGFLCVGADPNRNWAFHWMDGGASLNPCSDTYAGAQAFSEIETKSLSEYITTIADKLDVYLSFHSFSQLLLLPYGHSTAHIEGYDTLMDIGTKAKASLEKRYGTDYVVGNIAETIYIASGGSMDWVRGTFNTPITYTYELRDKGRNGFLLPADQIIPTGEETLDSVVTILEETKKIIG